MEIDPRIRAVKNTPQASRHNSQQAPDFRLFEFLERLTNATVSLTENLPSTTYRIVTSETGAVASPCAKLLGDIRIA